MIWYFIFVPRYTATDSIIGVGKAVKPTTHREIKRNTTFSTPGLSRFIQSSVST